MWLKAAKFAPLPAGVEKDASVAEVRAVFLAEALETGRVPNLKPDAWAFVGYQIAYEAHHRGQMT